jgi:superfamily II DNA/RNA helicase
VTWEDDADFVWFKPRAENESASQSQDENLEQSTVKDSLLLMRFYSLSSGIVAHLLSASDGSEVNLPFEVNREESIIIQHSASCFVLGRSGTGKTTVIVIKLLQREQQYLLSHEGPDLDVPTRESACKTPEKGNFLRQIIVTVSPYLCSAIKGHIGQFRR